MAAIAAILDPILTKKDRLLSLTDIPVMLKFQVNRLRNATRIVRTKNKRERSSRANTWENKILEKMKRIKEKAKCRNKNNCLTWLVIAKLQLQVKYVNEK